MKTLSDIVSFLQRGLFDLPTEKHDESPLHDPATSSLPSHVPALPLQIEPLVKSPADDVAAPLAYRHPQATHEVLLGVTAVGYQLRRARRRSIGMVVTPDGLRVSAPRWVAVRDIEHALREKSPWLLTKLAEQRERARTVQEAKVHWAHGVVLPYLGEPLTVVLGVGSPRSVRLAEVDGARQLQLGLPLDAEPDRISRATQKWLRTQALDLFGLRCEAYAAAMGVRITRLALSSARTRWGSASSTGSIRLHWRLVHFGLPTIDYVVVHELAHLREMNHSARFWAIVGGVLPDYEAARQELKTRVLPTLD